MSDSIQFVETDAGAIQEQMYSDFEAALGAPLYPGDERSIFLNQQLLVLLALYNAINETGKQNLLRYATGTVLDEYGARTNTPRLAAQKASTTLQFNLSAAQPQDITISAGTRATPDGALFFGTTESITIIAGQLSGTVAAEATVAGVSHNGFVSGQINKLVDPIPYVASVSNTTTSTDGTDIEPDDDGVNVWSGYRERIRESVTKFSTAGPEDAYIFWAKSADSNILDVAVTSPAACQVKITVLMQGGQDPTQATLDKVLASCSDKKIRPLSDLVTAQAPVKSAYNIDLTYYISEADAGQESAIKEAIEGEGGAIDQYKEWQSVSLGRAINPDKLKNLMLNAGANRAAITSPVYTAVAKDAVAVLGTVNIVYGGLE